MLKTWKHLKMSESVRTYPNASERFQSFGFLAFFRPPEVVQGWKFDRAEISSSPRYFVRMHVGVEWRCLKGKRAFKVFKNGKQSTRNIDGCIEHDAYNAYEKKDRRKRIEWDSWKIRCLIYMHRMVGIDILNTMHKTIVWILTFSVSYCI